MFYEDIFDIEDDYKDRHRKYASKFSSIFELKQEKKFYALYSMFTDCHTIVINRHMYEYELYDIKSMKPTDRILETSFLDNLHFFDIESFMESNINNHSLVLNNTKGERVEMIPAQLRSMITDGAIT
tara:strand:+ start:12061 stop:12441 length:381 start_codon:yes stop_codon:yes gene_type:complete